MERLDYFEMTALDNELGTKSIMGNFFIRNEEVENIYIKEQQVKRVGFLCEYSNGKVKELLIVDVFDITIRFKITEEELIEYITNKINLTLQ